LGGQVFTSADALSRFFRALNQRNRESVEANGGCMNRQAEAVDQQLRERFGF
jgi:hypothetical protein